MSGNFLCLITIRTKTNIKMLRSCFPWHILSLCWQQMRITQSNRKKWLARNLLKILNVHVLPSERSIYKRFTRGSSSKNSKHKKMFMTNCQIFTWRTLNKPWNLLNNWRREISYGRSYWTTRNSSHSWGVLSSVNFTRGNCSCHRMG